MIGTNGTAERNGTNGAGRPAAKRTRAVKPAAPRKTKMDPLHAWAVAGVAGTLVASAALNGMAFAEHAPNAIAGWALGVSIPAFVLTFSRVSALLYQRGRRPLAYAGAGATLMIVLLSIQHLAASIARLTGEPIGLAALMAIAIDVGLIVCELATVRGR